MKLNKKMLLVFVMVFALAIAGGGVFATNAHAECGLCSLNFSWLNPCNWHFPTCYSCAHPAAPPANSQTQQGAEQPFPNY
ncbi:MAG: hypothetical protein ACP5IL_00900 [Syntrophobacteraceae bacterium]